MRVVIRDPQQIKAVQEGRVVVIPLPDGGIAVVTQHNSELDGDRIVAESFPVEHEQGMRWTT